MKLPSSYRQQDLGRVGTDFIRTSLREGGSLSREVERAVDLGRGKATAFLQAPLADLRPETLERGGLASAKLSDEIAEEFIRRNLTRPQDVLIAENALAHCSDPWVNTRPLGVLCYLEEVLHLGNPDGAGSTSIAGALRAAKHSPAGQVSVVAAWNEEIPKSWPHRIQNLRTIAESVKIIVVSAFDGESYVIWQPGPS
jgi:hypothetical protein